MRLSINGGMKKEPIAFPDTHRADANARLLSKYKDTISMAGVPVIPAPSPEMTKENIKTSNVEITSSTLLVETIYCHVVIKVGIYNTLGRKMD